MSSPVNDRSSKHSKLKSAEDSMHDFSSPVESTATSPSCAMRHSYGIRPQLKDASYHRPTAFCECRLSSLRTKLSLSSDITAPAQRQPRDAVKVRWPRRPAAPPHVSAPPSARRRRPWRPGRSSSDTAAGGHRLGRWGQDVAGAQWTDVIE